MEFSPIVEIIQITRAPVFNRIQSAWFQMMVEQVPKGSPRLFADVGSVIYDNVESIGRSRTRNLRQKRFVSLAAFEELNPLFGLKMFR